MKKIALIPSRDSEGNPKLKQYLSSAGWETHFLSGYDSIFDAYSDGVKINNIGPEDKVILCHDDIEILSSPDVFNLFLDQKLDTKDVGFVGIAGTKLLGESGIWWEGLGTDMNTWSKRLSGLAMHGTLAENSTSYYGPCGVVAVLDGVFLCTKGSVLHRIQLTKPKTFSGNWDFYDLFYTTQAWKKGLKNYTVSIQLLHSSIGTTEGKDSWHANKEAFVEVFRDEFPIYVG